MVHPCATWPLVVQEACLELFMGWGQDSTVASEDRPQHASTFQDSAFITLFCCPFGKRKPYGQAQSLSGVGGTTQEPVVKKGTIIANLESRSSHQPSPP